MLRNKSVRGRGAQHLLDETELAFAADEAFLAPITATFGDVATSSEIRFSSPAPVLPDSLTRSRQPRPISINSASGSRSPPPAASAGAAVDESEPVDSDGLYRDGRCNDELRCQSIRYFALFSTDGEGRRFGASTATTIAAARGAARCASSRHDRRCRRVPVSGCLQFGIAGAGI